MELDQCPVRATTFMINKDQIIGFFSKSKVIFATTAAVITFSITLYNQFKSGRSTEISGSVSTIRTAGGPVDAVVQISSPISAQTETDNRGRFKFKIDNLQTDTFLLIVRNKRTNTVMKQNEYVTSSRGRTDITVVFDSSMIDGQTYNSSDTTRLRRRVGGPNIKKFVQGVTSLFH
jgi:predicted lipase